MPCHSHQYAIMRPAVIAVSQHASDMPPKTANMPCSRVVSSRYRCCFQAGTQFKSATFTRPNPIAGNLMYKNGLPTYSVVFVASNLPYETEIPPVIVIAKLEQFKYDEAAALAVVLLTFSLLTLIAINLLERWSKRHEQPA